MGQRGPGRTQCRILGRSHNNRALRRTGRSDGQPRKSNEALSLTMTRLIRIGLVLALAGLAFGQVVDPESKLCYKKLASIDPSTPHCRCMDDNNSGIPPFDGNPGPL